MCGRGDVLPRHFRRQASLGRNTPCGDNPATRILRADYTVAILATWLIQHTSASNEIKGPLHLIAFIK